MSILENMNNQLLLNYCAMLIYKNLTCVKKLKTWIASSKTHVHVYFNNGCFGPYAYFCCTLVLKNPNISNKNALMKFAAQDKSSTKYYSFLKQ